MKKLSVTALLVVSLRAIASFADGVDASMFSIKGFATVGVAHSSEHQADFVSTPYQPSGTGLSHDWTANIDSKLGAQVNANFTDNFSAVVQAVSQYQYDNTWWPMIEWANVKYQFTPDFSLRLGRIVLPVLLVSDSRLVGYSQPWVRPPEELYFDSIANNSDGGDITYRKQFHGVANTVQAFYGTATGKYSTITLKAKPTWGVNDTIEIDAWTLRAGYVAYKVDVASSGFDGFYGLINQFAVDAAASGYAAAAAQAVELRDKYHLNGVNIGIYTLGANYDTGDWFAMSEYAYVKADSFLADTQGFYVTAGYRITQFTPYVTLAQVKSHRIVENGISTAGLPADSAGAAAFVNAGMNAILDFSAADQRTASIGLRWDFMPNADLKIQCDRKSLFNDSNGRLFVRPGNSFQSDGDFNVFSAAIDFVF